MYPGGSDGAVPLGSSANHPPFISGAHSHTVSGSSISIALPHIELKIIKKVDGATVNTPPVGAIAFVFNTINILEGWALCDGQNGTLDDTVKLIYNSDTGLGATTSVSGSLTMNGANLLSLTWSHTHTSGTEGDGGQIGWPTGSTSAIYLGTGEYSHSHTLSSFSVSYVPTYYPVYLIQYIGL